MPWSAGGPKEQEPRTLTTARRQRASPVHAAMTPGGAATFETVGTGWGPRRGKRSRRSGGDGLNRHSLVAAFALVAGLGAALSAQATFSNATVNQKTIQSIRVTVIGCVADGADAGRYRLTNAVLSGDDIPSTAGTASPSMATDRETSWRSGAREDTFISRLPFRREAQIRRAVAQPTCSSVQPRCHGACDSARGKSTSAVRAVDRSSREVRNGGRGWRSW